MGGFGSGCHKGRKKTTVEECFQIDSRRWAREGIIEAQQFKSGSRVWTYTDGKRSTVNYDLNTLDMTRPTIRLWYWWVISMSKEQGSADYHVRLTTTQAQRGGLRWWFVCPLACNNRPCGRRVAKLYLPPGADYFGCRHCYDLTYTSCQESHKYDAWLGPIAAEAGWTVGALRKAWKERAAGE